jgi:DNA-binding beta-propeller fold protein YncE
MTKPYAMLGTVIAALAVSTPGISQPASQGPAREGPTLILAAKVPLTGVSGRIDHFTFDPKRRLTIFSGLGNNTIEIVNNFQGKHVKTIMGLNEPQGPLYVPGLDKLFVANAGSLFAGDADNVMAFTPASQSSTATGLGTPSVFSLPFGSLPVFVNTAQVGAVFVANYGTNTVSSLNTSSNVVSLTGAVGSHPVALAETPNTLNLYVANEGGDSVSVIDAATNTVAIPYGYELGKRGSGPPRATISRRGASSSRAISARAR